MSGADLVHPKDFGEGLKYQHQAEGTSFDVLFGSGGIQADVELASAGRLTRQNVTKSDSISLLLKEEGEEILNLEESGNIEDNSLEITREIFVDDDIQEPITVEKTKVISGNVQNLDGGTNNTDSLDLYYKLTTGDTSSALVELPAEKSVPTIQVPLSPSFDSADAPPLNYRPDNSSVSYLESLQLPNNSPAAFIPAVVVSSAGVATVVPPSKWNAKLRQPESTPARTDDINRKKTVNLPKFNSHIGSSVARDPFSKAPSNIPRQQTFNTGTFRNGPLGGSYIPPNKTPHEFGNYNLFPKNNAPRRSSLEPSSDFAQNPFFRQLNAKTSRVPPLIPPKNAAPVDNAITAIAIPNISRGKSKNSPKLTAATRPTQKSALPHSDAFAQYQLPQIAVPTSLQQQNQTAIPASSQQQQQQPAIGAPAYSVDEQFAAAINSYNPSGPYAVPGFPAQQPGCPPLLPGGNLYASQYGIDPLQQFYPPSEYTQRNFNPQFAESQFAPFIFGVPPHAHPSASYAQADLQGFEASYPFDYNYSTQQLSELLSQQHEGIPSQFEIAALNQPQLSYAPVASQIPQLYATHEGISNPAYPVQFTQPAISRQSLNAYLPQNPHYQNRPQQPHFQLADGYNYPPTNRYQQLNSAITPPRTQRTPHRKAAAQTLETAGQTTSSKNDEDYPALQQQPGRDRTGPPVAEPYLHSKPKPLHRTTQSLLPPRTNFVINADQTRQLPAYTIRPDQYTATNPYKNPLNFQIPPQLLQHKAASNNTPIGFATTVGGPVQYFLPPEYQSPAQQVIPYGGEIARQPTINAVEQMHALQNFGSNQHPQFIQ